MKTLSRLIPPGTVYDATRLNQLAADIVGLTFHKSSGSAGNVTHRVTLVRVLNFARLLLTELVALVVYSSLPQWAQPRGSFILDYGPRICLALTAFSLIVVTILDAAKYLENAEIFGKLHRVDEKLKVLLKSQPDHDAQRRDIWIASAVATACLLLLLIVTPIILVSEVGSVTNALLNAVLTLLFNTAYAIVYGNYMIKSYLVTKRFQQVNQLLESRLNTSNRRSFIWVRELPAKNANEADFVQTLSEIHAELHQTVDLLSEYQWIQIILISAVVIGFTTFNIFSVYRMLWTGNSSQFGVLVQGCLWNVYYIGLLVALLVRCSLVGWEGSKTNKLIYKALNNSKDHRTVASLRSFARQLYGVPVCVKLYFYDADFGTLFSVRHLKLLNLVQSSTSVVFICRLSGRLLPI